MCLLYRGSIVNYGLTDIRTLLRTYQVNTVNAFDTHLTVKHEKNIPEKCLRELGG